MGSGYTRQSASSISSGKSVTSAPVNNEFNQLQAAFSGTSGHAHDGTTGNGPTLINTSFGVTATTAGIIASLGSSGTPVGQLSTVTITGTSNRLTVTNGTGATGNPTLDISAAYVGQSSITTLGTIATGVWNGTILTGTYGGTGINNGSNTITIAGNVNTASTFTTSGAFGITLTATGATNVTLPTSGTLIGSTVTTLSSLNSIGTIGTGVWQGTKIGLLYGGTNADLSGTGGTSQVLKQTSLGGAITVAQLAVTDLSTAVTGSGSIVLATSPTLTTPTIGVATATSVNKVTITAPATSAVLTIANLKTLTSNNTLTLAGTDSTTITFQGTDTYVGRATTDTLTNKTYDTAGTGNVFKINGTGISAVTGTGSAVLSASPALTGTPTTPTATVGTNTTQVASTAFVLANQVSGALLAANNLSDLGTLATALTNLGFSTSLGSEGSVTLPGGLIFKWITNLTAGTNWQAGATWTFAAAFPTGLYFSTYIPQSQPNNPSLPFIGSSSASAVTFKSTNSADAFTAFAFAIGH